MHDEQDLLTRVEREIEKDNGALNGDGRVYRKEQVVGRKHKDKRECEQRM